MDPPAGESIRIAAIAELTKPMVVLFLPARGLAPQNASQRGGIPRAAVEHLANRGRRILVRIPVLWPHRRPPLERLIDIALPEEELSGEIAGIGFAIAVWRGFDDRRQQA